MSSRIIQSSSTTRTVTTLRAACKARAPPSPVADSTETREGRERSRIECTKSYSGRFGEFRQRK